MSSRHGPRSVGFMAGPGLEYADFEVANLAALYTDPDVSTGDRATVAACVELLGRADLVHIACHGQFRTDNPMFSSLQLADGPLIVRGEFAAGPHRAEVTFLNDRYDGTAATDRNLFVASGTYNGSGVAAAQTALFSTGPASFGFTDIG